MAGDKSTIQRIVRILGDDDPMPILQKNSFHYRRRAEMVSRDNQGRLYEIRSPSSLVNFFSDKFMLFLK